MSAGTRWIPLVLALGCGSDPHLERAGTALQSWEQARSSPSASARQAALQQALDADPGSIALRRSMARELGEARAFEEAVRLLNAVIPTEPESRHRFAIWDRAALHARAGNLPAAAQDLGRCIRLGVDPRALALDPAFDVLMAHADYVGVLPKAVLRVTEEVSTQKVLVGESWRRNILVSSPGQTVSLEWVTAPSDSLALREVVEDRISADEYQSERELRYEWEALRPGLVPVPAVRVVSAGQAAAIAPAELEVVQLGEKTGSVQLSQGPGILVPSHYDGAEANPTKPVTAVNGLVVASPAHESCTLTPVPAGAVRLVRREQGQPRWSGWWVPRDAVTRWVCPDQQTSLPPR